MLSEIPRLWTADPAQAGFLPDVLGNFGRLDSFTGANLSQLACHPGHVVQT
jgi:hypothetical protein